MVAGRAAAERSEGYPDDEASDLLIFQGTEFYTWLKNCRTYGDLTNF
jgi:hypothetical protein